MARYDGMDELLGRVRGRTAEKQAAEVEIVEPRVAASLEYESALNGVLALLREAERLHDALKDPWYREMPMADVEDLLTVLDKVQRELRRCEAAIQR